MLSITDNKSSMDSFEEVCDCETLETLHLASSVELSTSTSVESLKPYQ